MIDPNMAWRLRRRGLLITGKGEYTTPRLRTIAIEQEALMKRMNELDIELCEMARTDDQGNDHELPEPC